MHDKIVTQYQRDHLFSKITDGLIKSGISLDSVGVEDLWPVDQFHVGGPQSSIKLMQEVPFKSDQLWLDVGCGIGGVCRMLAHNYHVGVTGVDITPDYIETARMLTDLVGMTNQIRYEPADALNLPFEAQSFDGVWTQHVQMNLKSKLDFYRELNRVLKPRAYLVYHDLFAGTRTDLIYPTPWSDDGELSFLEKHQEVQAILGQLGLTYRYHQDDTKFAIEFFQDRLKTQPDPQKQPLGLQLLMGSSTYIKLSHVLENLKNGSLEVHQAILQK